MARPSRLEFAGAVYHVASHGAAGATVFRDDADRATLVDLLGQTLHRFDAQALAYSLGTEGYELLLFTRQANLSRLMRHLNGVYTQGCNRRHGGSGHLFQGRFRALLVDRERLLLPACMQVDRSAEWQGLAEDGKTWPWHSLPAHLGLQSAPDWLDVEGLYGHLLGRMAASAADRRRAAQLYARALSQARPEDLWSHLRGQIFLGDEGFARRMMALSRRATALPGRRSFAQWRRGADSREQALYRAHTEGGVSMTALAGELQLSVSRISRLIKGYERSAAAG